MQAVLVCRDRPHHGSKPERCGFCGVEVQLTDERRAFLVGHPRAKLACLACVPRDAELLGPGRTFSLEELGGRAKVEVIRNAAGGRDVRLEDGLSRGAKEGDPCSSCGRSMIPDASGLCRSCRKKQGRVACEASGGATSWGLTPGEEESCKGLPKPATQTTPTAAPEPTAPLPEPEEVPKEDPVVEAVATKPRFKVDEELEELEAAVSKKNRPCGCQPFGKHRKTCTLLDAKAKPPKPGFVRIKKPAPLAAAEVLEEEPAGAAPVLELGPNEIDLLLSLAELDAETRSRVIARAVERWS